jgi:Immunoglobulin domain/Laminin B (Domain IV)
MLNLESGSVLNITCRATGVPVPLIVWRLNWGHVPEKCSSTSNNGFGVLTCPDIQPIDSGAYSCEIINTMGTHFVTPDTILIVNGDDSPCPSGLFNSNAKRQEDCISCFCFGVSNQCQSANLFSYSLAPPVTSLTVLGVDPSGAIGEYENHGLIATRHGVQLRVTDIPQSRQVPYYSLPTEYRGNQLKSYGGYIRYDVEYSGRGNPTTNADIIITVSSLV